MKKLTVIFPGVGYNKDRPLLYYTARLAKSAGSDIVKVDFGKMEWDKETLKDRKKLLDALNFCIARAEEALKDVDMDSYEQIFFVSKSIGTVAAAAYAEKHSIKVKQIYFTPLEFFASFAEQGNGTVFYGTGDPYANPAEIARLCREKELRAIAFPDANHSLETEDVIGNIKSLGDIMEKVSDIIKGKSIYSFAVPSSDGSLAHISDYRGKVLMIVNTATGCGFTPQYEWIEKMYRTYNKDGFEVLDFPCNQFGRQAPGSNAEIHSFCTARYDISFTQFAKTEVNGEKELELYTFLKEKQGFKGFGEGKDAEYIRKLVLKSSPDAENDDSIKWNFTKFLVDRQGNVAARFEPTAELGKIEERIKELIV